MSRSAVAAALVRAGLCLLYTTGDHPAYCQRSTPNQRCEPWCLPGQPCPVQRKCGQRPRRALQRLIGGTIGSDSYYVTIFHGIHQCAKIRITNHIYSGVAIVGSTAPYFSKYRAHGTVLDFLPSLALFFYPLPVSTLPFSHIREPKSYAIWCDHRGEASVILPCVHGF